MNARLTDAGKTEANRVLDAWIDGCVSTAAIDPPGCPFRAIPNPGFEFTNVVWTLQTQPQFTVDPEYSAGGWSVKTTADGAVSATADAKRISDGATGTAKVGAIPFRFVGDVTFSGEGSSFTARIK